MSRTGRLCAALVGVVLTVSAPAVAGASVEQPEVVSDNPANRSPVLVHDDSLPGPRPHVDAFAQSGGTLYAGGLFDTVADSAPNGGATLARSNVMALDAQTFELSRSFDPVVDGNVWGIEATPSAVYVGGSFTTVNGVRRPALAKLDPVTGAVDPVFDAGFGGGRIEEVHLVDGRLIVAGKNGRKLMALDPTTGENTGYINLGISDQVPDSQGGVSVFDFAVNPQGTQLIAAGNFQTVAGQPRGKFFVADLGPNRATLNDWYYPGLGRPCTTDSPRRRANLQGVDYSPDGSHFAVTATGQIPRAADRGETVCDAAGYFDLSDDSAPEWINYTGGDSVWSTAVTGAAVYVQGHFSWLDNPNGFASKCPAGDPCAPRKGVGAIDPQTGRALPWNPDKPARQGGKDFLATPDGLWIGSDSRTIHGEDRRGLAFMPLP